MKTIIYIFLFLLPILGYPQQIWNKSSVLDASWINVGNAGFSAGGTFVTRVAFSPVDYRPYVAYMDNGNSRKATVMKFDETNWVSVGPAGFSAGRADRPSFAFSPSGEPWVAYSDSVNNMKATVMKFDGTDWVTVGNVGFTDGEAVSLSLAFSQSGKAYVSFRDGANNGRITVMTFDGSNWGVVGTAGISTTDLSMSCLAVDPLEGLPYVVYSGISTAYYAVGKKFDGSNWVDLGVPLVYAEYSMSLAFSPTVHQLYMAYGTGPVSVMKFDGTTWENVGNTNFSAGNATSACLAFNATGEPYVGYNDDVYNGRMTVMKFDGTNWLNVGDPGFSSDYAGFVSIALSGTGQPYVAFGDGSLNGKATVMKYDIPDGINVPQESGLFLYPNPARDKITIQIPVSLKESNLVIIDPAGQHLITCQINDLKTILDISNLSNGVYFMQLTNNRSNAVGKFIKK